MLTMTLAAVWENLADKLIGKFHDQEQSDFVRGSEAQAMKKTRILSPEEDIRRQINTMNSLEAVWKFVQRRA